ncbi:MAG TPA: hypothetical protein VFV50_07545 [Bdellovibrionales bacterium]|nr:hypothetical protein [Bdellovibrionales bacterium]
MKFVALQLAALMFTLSAAAQTDTRLLVCLSGERPTPKYAVEVHARPLGYRTVDTLIRSMDPATGDYVTLKRWATWTENTNARFTLRTFRPFPLNGKTPFDGTLSGRIFRKTRNGLISYNSKLVLDGLSDKPVRLDCRRRRAN